MKKVLIAYESNCMGSLFCNLILMGLVYFLYYYSNRPCLPIIETLRLIKCQKLWVFSECCLHHQSQVQELSVQLIVKQVFKAYLQPMSSMATKITRNLKIKRKIKQLSSFKIGRKGRNWPKDPKLSAMAGRGRR